MEIKKRYICNALDSMKEYYKEKLKVDLDLFRVYVSIILVLSAGIATLILKESFGVKKADYILTSVGGIFLISLLILAINTYLQIRKDLSELKK